MAAGGTGLRARGVERARKLVAPYARLQGGGAFVAVDRELFATEHGASVPDTELFGELWDRM
eukprot:3552110-Rhodomonas_salina.3